MCQQKNFSKVPMNANIFGGIEKFSWDFFFAVKIYLGDESPIHTNPVTARRRSESGPKTPTLHGRSIDVGVFRCRTVPKLPPLCSSVGRAAGPFRWGST